MEYFIIGAVVFIIGVISTKIILNRVQINRLELIKTNIENNLKSLNPNVQIVKNKDFDILLKIKNKKYLIKVLVHFLGKEIVVTNRNTWIIYDNGRLDIKNRIQVMTKFMDITTDDSTEKVVIIYPAIYLLKMYINENEMIILKSKDNVYNTKVLSYNDLKVYLEEIEDKNNLL